MRVLKTGLSFIFLLILLTALFMSFSLKKAHERNATIKELSATVQNESSLSLPVLIVLDNKAYSLKEKKNDDGYSEDEHNSTLSSFLHSKDSIDSKSEYELQNIHASIKQKMREKILLGDITPSDIILFQCGILILLQNIAILNRFIV